MNDWIEDARIFWCGIALIKAVSLGAALYIVVYVLIGLTTVHPTGPIVLSSFALSFNVLPFIGSIPILVNDPTKMGTAYGVWSSFVACNNILLEVMAGSIVSLFLSSRPWVRPSSTFLFGSSPTHGHGGRICSDRLDANPLI